MKSYRTLALKEIKAQKFISILILLALILSTMMTAVMGQAAVPIIPIAEAVALSIGACLLATWIPLRRISRMRIVDPIEAVE